MSDVLIKKKPFLLIEKLRFKFMVLGSTDGKSNTICVTSIETPDGRIFEIPDDLKPASKHTSIVYSDFYAKIRNSLKKDTKHNLFGYV